ncbi:MAG: fructosamine kinase family protein [Flavisolibacter sp.]
MPIPSSIQSLLQQKLSERFPGSNKIQFSPVGGGCINETARISWPGKHVFCKLNSATEFPGLFETEKRGLEFIARQHVIRVPAVVDCFESNGKQVLLLEWINEADRTEKFWKVFGEQLAALHHISSEHFGFDGNNYMGSVPQSNRYWSEWDQFFVEERLEPLVRQCADKNLLLKKHVDQFHKLYLSIPSIFNTDQKPALIHGDLWSGNFMCDQQQQPVLIDPAVYFGHPSVDLGMTTLFGGFGSGFYDAYNYHAPFPKNYIEQWKICNLYPLLIHLLLFGKTYLSQIDDTLFLFV